MKIKPLVSKKKIKYNMMKFKLDLSKPLLKDTDKDGLPDIYDCSPRNPRKKGLGHLISGHRAKKELKVAKEMDLPIDEEYETELKEAVSKGDKEKKRIKENVKAGFKGTEKNIGRFAKEYVKRSESPKSDPRMQKPISQVKKCYLIPAPQKAYYDWEKNEPSSIPHYQRDKYVAFKPPVVRGLFRPHQAPLPKYLIMRKLRRLILYYQETGQVEKLRELQEQLRGGENR
jgi:hypothetical protein